MCKNPLIEEKFRELDAFIDNIKIKQGALITVLHKAQEIFGYLPKEVQLHVARKLDTTAATVHGVVTFYSYFTEKPKGKHVINVCLGTACYVRGAEAILKKIKETLNIQQGEITKDGKFSLDCIRCVGACGLAPVISIDGKIYGNVKPENIEEILKEYE